ncbi:MAG: parvulin-like peptidyl-prolyl isomerase [Rhodothermales bacterium]|jgi:parvulin-like peptidyl-prolyl isomerase
MGNGMTRTGNMICALVGLLALAGCSPEQQESQTLAIVNGRPISLAQYQRGYTDYLFSGGLPDEPLRRSAFLNRMIAVELIVTEAREGGVESSEEFQTEQERARQKLLIEALLADAIYSEIQVSDADLVDMFVRVNTKMTARHLFATTREDAELLRERLASGESFESLAAEVFTDPVLIENGGLLGTFGFDEMDPAFEDEAFTMKVGEISEPVQTSQGFSVIKLENRFSDPVMTESEFAQKRGQLAGYVRSRKQANARRDFLAALVQEAGVRIDPAKAEDLVRQVTSGAIRDPEDDESGTFVSFDREGAERVWTVADFREAAEYTSDRQQMAVDNVDDLTAFIKGLVARDIMLSRATDAGLGRDMRVRQGIDSAMSEWVYERAFGQLVDNMPLSDEEVRAYFEEHPDDFELPPRVQLSEIVVATRQKADSLKAIAKAGSFEALARRHSLRPASAGSGGSLGLYAKSELGPWGDDVFSSQPGTVLGPYGSAGKYLLLLVGSAEMARPATFEEARGEAQSMLARERQQAYLRQHVQALRLRFPVTLVVDSLDGLPL